MQRILVPTVLALLGLLAASPAASALGDCVVVADAAEACGSVGHFTGASLRAGVGDAASVYAEGYTVPGFAGQFTYGAVRVQAAGEEASAWGYCSDLQGTTHPCDFYDAGLDTTIP